MGWGMREPELIEADRTRDFVRSKCKYFSMVKIEGKG